MTINDAGKEWQIVKEDSSKISATSSSLPLVSKIASVLVNRGINTVKIKNIY
ncbi:MAG: hypothetical protein LBS81_02400 [Endomicrobium sp.]|nr:hypothetical protein [Endomicrobium sp.]